MRRNIPRAGGHVNALLSSWGHAARIGPMTSKFCVNGTCWRAKVEYVIHCEAQAVSNAVK